LRRVAAAPPAFGGLPPGFDRILDERLCVFFGPNNVFTSVYPFRLPDVAEVLAEVREAVRARGVSRVEWWIGPDVDPPDVAASLRELGLSDHEDPHVKAMALLAEPPKAEEEVTARPVHSLEELRLASEIGADVFGLEGARREALLGGVREEWETREGRYSRAFLAFHGEQAVGAARSAYLDAGAVLLIGGSVLPEWRGRGAYRALVRARWDDAVERDTPALLVHAGRMSRPALERLGFEPICDLEIVVDELE
jgi:GNAT superfamily N-acetyltransferase